MEQRIEEVRDRVLAHPFHHACGLELLSAEDGAAEIAIAMNEFTLNPEGALHGGVLYAFVDVACFFAAVSKLEAHQHPVSIETHVSLLRAARSDDRLTIRAGVDRLGRTLAAMRAEVHADNGERQRLIATGSVTKSILEERTS
jgi:uncharacterized protein (TIGR00369 family)